jgi:uncharacterized protein YkvS
MEATLQKAKIVDAYENVRSFSYSEKKSPFLDDKKINAFLDAIIDFKKTLKAKTEKLNELNERLQNLTWFDNLDDESMMKINDLIAASKDLHSSFIRQYASMSHFRNKGIAKDEIINLKNGVDDLKEIYTDLESVFFFLPSIPEFIETTKQLSLV